MSFLRFNSPYAQQVLGEVERMCNNHVRGAKSILEVGSCFGHNLLHMANVAAPGAVIRVVDIGRWPEHSGCNIEPYLKDVCGKLRARGFDVELKIGDSRDPSVVEWARQFSPYDFVFIDGDHSFDGVKADWTNYGPMGRKVGFHDILNRDLGVKPLWDELRHNYEQVVEIANPMGIGIIERR